MTGGSTHEDVMEKEGPGKAADAFRRYAQAFQSLDPRAVARHFNEPALLIMPQGVLALSTAADVEQAYARIMADLPALGYARTEFASLAERQLSDDLALVTGSGVWKKATGEAFMPFGMTYTLRRSADTWRIVVAAIHDPD
jgi:ketosteroid isomerase-like protein